MSNVNWGDLLAILAMAGTSAKKSSMVVRWYPLGAHFVRRLSSHVWSRWSFRRSCRPSVHGRRFCPLQAGSRERMLGTCHMISILTWLCPNMFQAWNPVVYQNFLYEHSHFPNFLDNFAVFFSTTRAKFHAIVGIVCVFSVFYMCLHSTVLLPTLHFEHFTGTISYICESCWVKTLYSAPSCFPSTLDTSQCCKVCILPLGTRCSAASLLSSILNILQYYVVCILRGTHYSAAPPVNL